MNLIEQANVIHYHRKRLGGSELHALGWRGLESQRLRFETLCGIANLNDCSILDVGCGYGDLRGFLDTRFRAIVYLGIDQMGEFVAHSRHKYSHLSHTHFLQADFLNVILPNVDYILASGAFGYRSSNRLYPYNVIQSMWEAAAKGIAFNMLDAAMFEGNEVLAGRDVDEVMSFCRMLDPNAELLRGYLEDDFTVWMRK